MRKKSIAMLLAGGQGTRLHQLTEKLAKPAVAYGGKYRIIDFALSNCTNSGIDTVGILTQYMPLDLNAYIGDGYEWDLDRNNGGVAILPPYSNADGLNWYKGTASAIYENMAYIDQYNPEYVIILSGDHIYHMNYSEMLAYHEEKNADVSIAVYEVPWSEASRFGIMNTDEQMNITKFDEKPQQPKSNLASMGIYIFKTDILRTYLENDAKNPTSSYDFGNDIIPKLLADRRKLVAYPFSGYWKDVGTIDSLWESNMDLLRKFNNEDHHCLDLYDRNWKVYSKTPSYPAQFIDETAQVIESMITEGCVIKGKVIHSIVFQGSSIEENSTIIDSVIMNDAIIGKHVSINRAIIAPGTIVPDYAILEPNAGDGSIKLYTNAHFQKLSDEAGTELLVGDETAAASTWKRKFTDILVDKETYKTGVISNGKIGQ